MAGPFDIFGEFARLMKVQAKAELLAQVQEADEKTRNLGPARTTEESWRELLGEVSDLAVEEPLVRRHLTQEQIDRRWLGLPPAGEEAIAAAEQRLNVELGVSYKAFLRVSNGWLWPSAGVHALLPVEHLRPFSNDHRDWTSILLDETIGPVSEIRRANLPDAIQISDYDASWDDSAWLMIPGLRDEFGEPEIWDLSEEGETRHRSFWHVMRAQLRSYQLLRTDLYGEGFHKGPDLGE